MTDAHLAAQDAAEALIVLGWPVKPYGDDMEMWRIGDGVFSDAELLEFAAWAGIVVSDGTAQ